MKSKFFRSNGVDTEEREEDLRAPQRLPSEQPSGLHNAWFPEACKQLRAISTLPAGWDSHGAGPPASNIVENAIVLLRNLTGVASFPKPHIHPTPSGGVQFEWESAGRYFEVELFSPNEARYYFQDTEARLEEEHSFDYDKCPDTVLEYLTRTTVA